VCELGTHQSFVLLFCGMALLLECQSYPDPKQGQWFTTRFGLFVEETNKGVSVCRLDICVRGVVGCTICYAKSVDICCLIRTGTAVISNSSK